MERRAFAPRQETQVGIIPPEEAESGGEFSDLRGWDAILAAPLNPAVRGIAELAKAHEISLRELGRNCTPRRDHKTLGKCLTAANPRIETVTSIDLALSQIIEKRQFYHLQDQARNQVIKDEYHWPKTLEDILDRVADTKRSFNGAPNEFTFAASAQAVSLVDRLRKALGAYRDEIRSASDKLRDEVEEINAILDQAELAE